MALKGWEVIELVIYVFWIIIGLIALIISLLKPSNSIFIILFLWSIGHICLTIFLLRKELFEAVKI